MVQLRIELTTLFNNLTWSVNLDEVFSDRHVEILTLDVCLLRLSFRLSGDFVETRFLDDGATILLESGTLSECLCGLLIARSGHLMLYRHRLVSLVIERIGTLHMLLLIKLIQFALILRNCVLKFVAVLFFLLSFNRSTFHRAFVG